MQLSDVILSTNVLCNVSAPSKVKLLHALASKASKGLDVTEEVIFDALDRRENLGSTGIGLGIAVPHATISELADIFILVCRLGKAIDFEAIDGEPVDLIFLLLVPVNRKSEYLTILAAIARHMRADGVLEAIRKADTADQIYIAVTDGR